MRWKSLTELTLVALFCTACGGADEPLTASASKAAAAERADTAALLRELNALAAWHEDQGSGLALQPGLAGDVRARALEAFACEPTDELLTLWQWRDGESGHHLFWYHRFLSLDEASAAHTTLSWLPFIGWQDHWIPVAEFEGEWIFTECADKQTPGLPVGRFLLESGAAFGYDNLTRYVQTLNASIAAGALTWQDDWWLEAAPGGLGDIHREINAHGAFPYAEP